jgi:N-acetylneuraminate synthase/N,N'-diacetyllegionaminate synthase
MSGAETKPEAVTVRIGDRPVGDGQGVLIVAEAGVNHDGVLDQALRLVDAAADAGADVVKFQMFRAAELVTATATVAGYQQARGVRSQREMLARLELSDHDFARLAAHCRARSIEFLATPFNPPDVDRLLALHVRALKIASPDLVNPPLLRRAAETGLPLLLSTGASTADEIAAAVAQLRGWGAAGRLILLHCVSGYPAPLDAANLGAIATLRRTFGVPAGFSDHTRSTAIAGWAVAAGACVLEKHFTLDRDAAGPDHAASLDPKELGAYVRAARDAEAALGAGALGMSPLEADIRAVARQSVVSARHIPAGALLTAEMLTVKRPGGGIEPGQLEALFGRRAAADIPADTVLTWELVQ